MSLSKPKRHKDKANLNYIKELPCIICGETPVDPDHFKTKGAGGGDQLTNLNPLCRLHHIEKGTMGVKTFWEQYHMTIIETRKKLGLPALYVWFNH